MEISDLVKELCRKISEIKDIDRRIETVNLVRKSIHQVSPMKHHPVDFVFWEKSENVEGNDYNPNSVAPPEMKLLIKSITEDGYTMPIVTYNENGIKIVDGFHRRKSSIISSEIRNSTHGYIPLTNIREKQKDISNLMASTIRHNRARGEHSISKMTEIVAELVKSGMSDAWILKNIGMDADELLRHKQLSGLQELFFGKDFSKSWEI